jgi:class 3 adenylate cyclase
VTLNDRLDYFGGTVNLAARLQGESRGGDVIVSATLLEGLGAAATGALHHARSEERASLRGLAAPVAFVRFVVGAVPDG